MTIDCTPTTVRLCGHVAVEEAEALFDWIRSNPQACLDLRECTHIHAANLQVLMATRPAVEHWPDTPELAAWLRRALQKPDEEMP